jgi:acyl-coenzyme A synthetase/AMP-(fatty) acid ligase
VLPIELRDKRMTLKAFIVMNGVAFDPKSAARALQDHVKQRLVPYKYPRFVQFLPELPKTGTGKVDRQALLKVTANAQDVASAIGERPRAPVSRSNRGRPLRKQGGRS